MRAHEIRQKYIEFFKERGHLQVPSASLVPIDALGNADNSTLFTGSGMQQFKPYFTGAATPPHTRLATVQKCVRAKDIDEVGDFSHCTFFEMLGNFSFGDYFKADVIPWTWEFITKVVGLDPDRICVTVFIDDDEAFQIWHDVVGLPVDRIHRLGEDKNYWPANAISAGPNGPCGPCSEIFYRVAPLEEMTTDPALSPTERYLIDDNAGRWTEIWNNVFTQFNRGEDENGKVVLTPLPKKNNDTGAGLDRLAYCALNKTSVFETDLFGPILDEIARLSGKVYTGTMSPTDFAFRVVAEHTRAMVFCIADGISPGNEKRDYILRYIMRRAIRYGKAVLGFEQPFLHEVAPTIIKQMGDFYPELVSRQHYILTTIQNEEVSFRRTLDNGMRILFTLLESGTVQETRTLSGAQAFDLHSTYGFPLDLTIEIAREQGIEVDREGFEEADRIFRGPKRAKGDVFGSGTQGVVGEGLPPTRFLGYDQVFSNGTILAIYSEGESVEQATEGEMVTLVLDQTPFYAESGGQVGDTGHLVAQSNGQIAEHSPIAEITDTRKSPLGVYLHTTKILGGSVAVGTEVVAIVDAKRRLSIQRNHTATHLLQAAMQQVLGGHVHQKGSLVASDRLRFDFTHNQPVTYDELLKIEQVVNEQILNGEDVKIFNDVPIDEARGRGAMALFGEKYGERVRVVEVPGFSVELCGGIHVQHLSQIGLFKILSETGVSAGVRRIEAITGRAAYDFFNRREESIQTLAELFKTNPNDLVGTAERLVQQRKDLEKQNKQLKEANLLQSAADISPQDVEGIPLIVHRIDDTDSDTIVAFVDKMVDRLGSIAVVVGGSVDGKAIFVAKISKDLVGQGLHAGNLLRELAKITGGGGGGRPDFAQAGGRDPGKVPEALNAAPGLVSSQKRKV